jgi:hypothetical protein
LWVVRGCRELCAKNGVDMPLIPEPVCELALVETSLLVRKGYGSS